jgi:group I intron endonuclease
MILLYSSTGGTGIGIYNCLFHSTAIRHSFDLFISIIGVILLLFSESCLAWPGVNSTDFASILLVVIPVTVYSNADIQKVEIIKENRGKSGVYRWTNLVSGKTYVGSGTNLTKRLSAYYSLACLIKNDCMLINKAFLKYGYSNFKLEILEYCEPSKCIEREQHFIDAVQPEYNILKTAGSSLGFQHTEESKRKMSEAQREIDNYGRFKKGHQHTEEVKKRISAAKLGISLSEYTRRRMSAARKGKTKIEGSGRPSVSIEVLDLETGIKTIYPSTSEAARALGIRRVSISQYLSRNQQKPFKNKYRFYYL